MHGLAELGVRDAQDRDVSHRRVQGQRILDLPGIDVHSTGQDQVRATVRQIEIALLVEMPEVAESVPATVVERRGRLVLVVVVFEWPDVAKPDRADLPDRKSTRLN